MIIQYVERVHVGLAKGLGVYLLVGLGVGAVSSMFPPAKPYLTSNETFWSILALSLSFMITREVLKLKKELNSNKGP